MVAASRYSPGAVDRLPTLYEAGRAGLLTRLTHGGRMSAERAEAVVAEWEAEAERRGLRRDSVTFRQEARLGSGNTSRRRQGSAYTPRPLSREAATPMTASEQGLVEASDGVLAAVEEMRGLELEQRDLHQRDPQRATVRSEMWRAARRLVSLAALETHFVRRVHKDENDGRG
jgi:hypothetical protein